MRQDYQKDFFELGNKLRDLGYDEVRETELLAEFRLKSGWKLLFKCERYYGPAFALVIVPPEGLGRAQGYAVWLLMLAFEELQDESYGNPTIDAQINFLIRNRDQIFNSTSYYEDQYFRLNDVPT
ncbi:MAG: hypothetical protein ABI612_07720 [Betaproteobacteria bacterium]